MRVICTACLRRLYIAPDRMPAEEPRFNIVCPQCSTALLVDALQGLTFAEGATAYALDGSGEQPQPSELVELRAAVERMVGKIRTGLRRPSDDWGNGRTNAHDLDGND